MAHRLPPSYWVTTSVVALVCVSAYFGIRSRLDEQTAAREIEITQSQSREANRYCANWRSDPKQFAECALALVAYFKCENTRLDMLLRTGREERGVYCEHSV